MTTLTERLIELENKVKACTIKIDKQKALISLYLSRIELSLEDELDILTTKTTVIDTILCSQRHEYSLFVVMI